MQWNDHSRLTGQHAFLGASKYHWLNYDAQRLADAYLNFQAKERGTRLHAFAAECINLNQKLPKSKKTLNAYVNDAIGFRMTPEQVLYYSENCFGTADTISFDNKTLRMNYLRTIIYPDSRSRTERFVKFQNGGEKPWKSKAIPSPRTARRN